MIVRSLKSSVTKQINLLHNTLDASVRQRSFFDLIVCTEADLNRILRYTIENPMK